MDSLPEYLTEHIKSWVVWKEINTGRDKPVKIPYSAYDGLPFKGTLDSSNNASRLASYDQALNELKACKHGKWSGLGIMFTGNGLVGIDIDNCISSDKIETMASIPFGD